MIESSKQLTELSHLAEALNQETDAYSEALSQLEKKLRKMNLGIEAWVTLTQKGVSGSPGRDSSLRTMLGYAKTSDGWGFAVKDIRVESGFYENDESCPYENHYEQGDPKPLLKSSRELRTLAASRMAYLLNELRDQAATAIKALQEARDLADQA